jgi:hypothetical protein
LPHHKNRKAFEEKYPELSSVSYEVRYFYAIHEGWPLTDSFDTFEAFEHVRACTECWESIKKSHHAPDKIAKYRRSA